MYTIDKGVHWCQVGPSHCTCQQPVKLSQPKNLPDCFDATNVAAADLHDMVFTMLTQCLDDPCDAKHMFVLHEV